MHKNYQWVNNFGQNGIKWYFRSNDASSEIIVYKIKMKRMINKERIN